MLSVPLDNLRATGGPHSLMAYHVSKGVVQKADPEWLANDPGVEVQYQESAVLFAVPIQDVKTLLQERAIAVHRHPPLPERVHVIQFEHDRQGIQFSLRRLHGIRLLIVDPVTHITDTRLCQELWGAG